MKVVEVVMGRSVTFHQGTCLSGSSVEIRGGLVSSRWRCELSFCPRFDVFCTYSDACKSSLFAQAHHCESPPAPANGGMALPHGCL